MFVQRKARRTSKRKLSHGLKKMMMLSVVMFLPFTMVMIVAGQTAVDPGVRGGPAGAGGFIKGLTSNQQAIESKITSTFSEVNTVVGSIKFSGLGPRFDSNGCAGCHLQPAVGGSSLAVNPLFNVFQLDGATNTMPAFETSNGPTVIARLPFQSDLVTPDGHVHQLFTITGRTDNGSCVLSQPDFATAAAQNNLVLRTTTPTFGGGLLEIIQSSDIIANMNANTAQKQALGISGHPNIMSDGGIGRFGWKAFARSLLEFSGGAYQIEEGVSDEFFPNEIDETPGCVPPMPNGPPLGPAGVPSDRANYGIEGTEKPVDFPGDPERFALFMRFLDQPTPGPSSPSTTNGQTQFNNVGCALCHNASFTTPKSSISALSNVQANLFSDLLVHHMGPCLADNVPQGTAKGDEFRTAPLWGVGQRVFFMHDGRTSDIVQAVEDHFCLGNAQYPNSEANAVISNFNALSPQNQQDLINFLRSL